MVPIYSRVVDAVFYDVESLTFIYGSRRETNVRNALAPPTVPSPDLYYRDDLRRKIIPPSPVRCTTVITYLKHGARPIATHLSLRNTVSVFPATS